MPDLYERPEPPAQRKALKPNVINLLIVCALMLVVSACFCRSGRGDSGTVFEEADDSSITNTSPAERRSGTVTGNADNGDFVVKYAEVETPRYRQIDRQIKEEKLIENAADKLNRALKLPHDITLQSRDCKEQNAYYDPRDRSVTICYELMERFYNAFRSAGLDENAAYEKMFDAVRFVFLHEIGHALIDAYKLPVTGGEEDSADRLSAFVNLRELGDEGVRAVFAAADAFAIESRNKPQSARNMADEHLQNEQRFYNSLCMIYGSNPEKHTRIVSDGYLPKERAVRCQNEYQRTVESWMTLLEPWRKG
jgi:hypothetical protein